MPGPRRAERLSRWAGPIGLAALFVWLVARDWRRTGDPLIDFGRELYEAWRVARGGLIGRDVVTLFGPWSAAFNGLVFRVFGSSLGTMLWTNALLAAAATWMLFALFSRLFDRGSAFLATAAFLSLSAFADVGPVSNYNFLTPYATSATHGFIVLVALLFALERWLQTSRDRWAAMAGLALGVLVLIKPETLFAGALALGLAVALTDRTRRWRALVLAAAGAVVPVLVSVGLLARTLPLSSALATSLGALGSLKAPAVGQPFYAHVAGLDAPGPNLLRLVFATVEVVAAFGAVAWVDLKLARSGRRKLLDPVVAVSVAALFGAFVTARYAFDGWSRALPLVVLASGADAFRQRDRPRMVVALAALAMLAKIPLHTGLAFYGFVLTPLALMLVVATLAHTVPARLSTRGAGPLVRWCTWTMTAALCIIGARQTARVLATHTVQLAEGGDAWLVEPARGRVALALEHELAHRMRSSDTLAVLPAGAAVNFLLRRLNPTPYVSLAPSEIACFGQRRIVGAFAARPPELVVLVGANYAQFGLGAFGTEPASGEALMRWLEQHYRQTDAVLSPNGAFVQARILRRK